jgi:hypothetical protein
VNAQKTRNGEAKPALRRTEKSEFRASSVLSTPTTLTTLAKPRVHSGRHERLAAQLLTEIYKVGVGDILDVRFMNSANEVAHIVQLWQVA